MSEYIFLPPDQLKLHPQNIRLYYPSHDVAKMAGSIKKTNGVLHAMLVTPIPGQPTVYYVVDGNLRLAAARTLAGDCPPLKCEVVEASLADQLLAMVITSEFHFPKDPVSMGRHFQRLIQQEKLTIEAITEDTDVSRPTIEKYLKILELEDEIQQLIAAGRLSADLRVSRALLLLPAGETRIRAAERFARNDSNIRYIIQACRQIQERAAVMAGQDHVERLDAERARQQAVSEQVGRTKQQNNGHARMGPEAARLIYDLAEKMLCDDCRLDGLSIECYLCPGPQDFVNHLIEMAEIRIPEEVAS